MPRDPVSRRVKVMVLILGAVFVAALFVVLREHEPSTTPPLAPTAPTDEVAESQAYELARALEKCYGTSFDYTQCQHEPRVRARATTGSARVALAEDTTYVVNARSATGTTFAVKRINDELLLASCEPPRRGRCGVAGHWSMPARLPHATREDQAVSLDRAARRFLRRTVREMDRCLERRRRMKACALVVARQVNARGYHAHPVEIRAERRVYVALTYSGSGNAFSVERDPDGDLRSFCSIATDRGDCRGPARTSPHGAPRI